VSLYFVLAFAISWGGLVAIGGLGGLSGATWQSDPRLPLFVLAMLAGPSVAGIVLTIAMSGRPGLQTLLSRLVRWRVGARWYVVALLTAPAVFAVVHFTLSRASPVFLPGLVTRTGRASILVPSIGGALAVGLFEELGWTGFATPVLRQRFSATRTGLLVGVAWGAWHLLTNDIWIARTYSGSLSVSAFAFLNGLSLVLGQLPAYRVLMTWVYDRTGSLFVAILMHASLSACTFVLGPENARGGALVAYGVVLAAAWWAMVAVASVAARHHVSRQRSGRPGRS
jgi:CAAX protease family protein